MAKYLVTRYDKYGKKISSRNENLSTNLGRWKQSQNCDKRDGSKVRLYTAQTNDNNRIGVGYYCKNLDGTRLTIKLNDKNVLNKLKKKK